MAPNLESRVESASPVHPDAPARNIFMASSPWEAAYGRPVTQFESRVIGACEKLGHEEFIFRLYKTHPDRRQELVNAKKSYATLNLSELPVCLIDNRGFLFTQGLLVTTQGLFWNNSKSPAQHLTFSELSPGDVTFETGWIGGNLKVAPNHKIETTSLPKAMLGPFADFLNEIIELAAEHPGSAGPTPKAIGRALDIRANEREQVRLAHLQEREKAIKAFLRKKLPGKTVDFIGIGFWDTGITAEKIAGSIGVALLTGGYGSAPKTWAFGIFAATTNELCIINMMEIINPDDVDYLGLFKEPPKSMSIERLAKKSIQASAHGRGNHKDLVLFEGEKKILAYFPRHVLPSNESVVDKLVERFKKPDSKK
jgi:hypothetical protein